VRSSTSVVEDQTPLGSIDIAALGARSGFLWRNGDLVLAGVGPSKRLLLTRPIGVASVQDRLSELSGPNELAGNRATGPVAFGALPFDPRAQGWLDVPSIVLGESEGSRWLTVMSPLTELDARHCIEAVIQNDVRQPRPRTIDVSTVRAADEWRDDVVRAARDRIVGGELSKAVLSRELELTADVSFDPASIVDTLVKSFTGAHVFSVDGFVGASPELLVARDGRCVTSHPLAGTARRGDDSADDDRRTEALLASTKDRREHQITIDWLLAELLQFSSYIDAEPEPTIVTMPNVHHLGTRVEGMLSEPAASVLDLVAAVHPTPALGGHPRDSALSLIAELEGFDRLRYGGPVGWVDADGNGEFAVGIRSAQLDGASARVVAGVGVVADSDPQAELEETQAKFRAMLGVLLAP